MKKILLNKISFIFLVLFFLVTPFASEAANRPINVYLFTSGTSAHCPFCAQTVNYFNILQKNQYPELTILHYPLEEKNNYKEKFDYFTRVYNIANNQVPVAFIGEEAIVGYEPTEFKSALDTCRQNTCIDPEDYLVQEVQANPSLQKEATPKGLTVNNSTVFIWIFFGVVLGLVLIVFFNRRR